MNKLIAWKGNLATDPVLDGFVGDVCIASIRPRDGKLVLASANGLEIGATYATGVKDGKQQAETGFRDFLLAMGARMYTPDELVIVQGLLANRGDTDEKAWRLIAELWYQQGMHNFSLVASIHERLARLQEDVDRRREALQA